MTDVPDNRYIKVTKVYGRDNKLKGYTRSTPVTADIFRIPMPKLDYEFNKGGAVVKKEKTKMMYGGMAKKKMMMGGYAKKNKK
jgi:hypothetical protein